MCNKFLVECQSEDVDFLTPQEIIERLNKLKGCQYIAISKETRSDSPGIYYTLIFACYQGEKKETSIKNKLKVNDNIKIDANGRTCRKCRDEIFRDNLSAKQRQRYIINHQEEWGDIPPDEIKKYPEHHPSIKLIYGKQIRNYSHQRIKAAFADLNMEVRLHHAGYKGNRVPNFKERYDVIDSSGNLVYDRVPLDYLRYYLHQRNIPLKKAGES